MTYREPTLPPVGLDHVLAFTIPARNARGRMVRLGPVLGQILAAHDYPPVMAQALAEALVLTAMMGSLLKGAGDQLTMQAQSTDGQVRLLVCDYRDGELRGYLEPADALPDPGDAAAQRLFSGGHLAITFDIAATKQRYQGVVSLEGASLTEVVQNYFAQSEQVPTLVRTAVDFVGGGVVAAGLLAQHLPEGEEGRERLHVQLDHPEWEHVAILAGSAKPEELVDPSLPLDDLLWRLFHEEGEVRVAAGQQLVKGCRCTQLHFESVLSRFSKEDRREMADDDGVIVVDCAFCSRKFDIQD